MQFFRLTDEQLIARVRRGHRTRRYWGAAFLIVGVTLLIVASIYIQDFSRQALEVADSVADVAHPTDADLQLAADNTRFYLGFALGFLAAGVVSAAVSLIGFGVGALLTSDQKTRILLDCWDREHAAR